MLDIILVYYVVILIDVKIIVVIFIDSEKKLIVIMDIEMMWCVLGKLIDNSWEVFLSIDVF